MYSEHRLIKTKSDISEKFKVKCKNQWVFVFEICNINKSHAF